MVAGPDEAAHHYEPALELVADPARRTSVDVDVSKLAVNAADALSARGQPFRAAALLKEQLACLPADAPVAWRARMLAGRAYALAVVEPDEDPVLVSAEAVALVPADEVSPLRARVLAVHARVLASRGRDETAQAVGLDALALAEKLDLGELASDVITTLSGLRKTGPVEGVRAALEEAVARAERTGALQAEIRGRVLLGRSYEDWGDYDQTERWFRSAIERAEAAGIPFAPWAFEGRWQLAWVEKVRGHWQAALDLTEVPGQDPPPIAASLFDCLRLGMAVARGEDVGERVRALRRHWRKEGLVAIFSAGIEMELAARAGDPAGVVRSYDDVVANMTEIWHEWFTARVRLAASAVAGLAQAMPQTAAADRATYAEEADRLHREGRTVLERSSDPSAFWGPEGRAWSARLEAERRRVHWLCGATTDQDKLLGAWRETVEAFAEFGDVHELARVRTTYAGILRATGDTAGAREQADLAREAARALGAQPLLDELRAIGGTAVRHDAASDALTPREREILALVAEGRSNGEIGKQLFISTKTVSVHVSNILAKLGAGSRTEAAAVARERGLLG
jgi:DNA-binding CsgD family transcriptional regulator/tetratricopeptide (TPR) repeat protein